MSVTPKGYITLIHGEKGLGYAIMKMDAMAMAIIDEGLRNSIQKYEQMEDGDTSKLAKIKELEEQIVYCRQSSLRE